MCLCVCVSGGWLALQLLLCLLVFCLCPQVARDTLSCFFSPVLVTGCVCVCLHVLHMSACVLVRVGVFVCEILCVSVGPRESGCEKTSARLLQRVCPGSSVVCEQDSRVVSRLQSVHLCVCVTFIVCN